MKSLWDNIKRSTHPAVWNERRADPEHPFDFFLGKSFDGYLLFMLRLKYPPAHFAQYPKISNIEFNYEQTAEGNWQFRLLLLDSSNEDIFSVLCSNLMHATLKLSPKDETKALNIVLTRIRRWQDLLEYRRNNLLSRNKIIGFIGELLFLKNILLQYMDPLIAIKSWRGPYGEEQDFILNGWLLEIKSQSASSDKNIKINSEHQLDTSSGYIILCYQTLQSDFEDDSAYSLNGLVQILLDQFEKSNIFARDIFNSLLIEYGYFPHGEYDEDKWKLHVRQFFKVDENFPRITPDKLPNGVSNTKYTLNIDSCDKYKITFDKVMEQIFNV